MIIWAIIAGLLMPIQGVLNSRLTFITHHPLMGAWVSFLIGTIFSTVMMFFYPKSPDFKTLLSQPWWLFLGGCLGVGFVYVATLLMPRYGALVVMMAFLIGQIVMSLFIDHWGWFGLPQLKISFFRIISVLMIISGFYLLKKSS